MAELWERDLRSAIRTVAGAGWTARKSGTSSTQLIFRPPIPHNAAGRPLRELPAQPSQSGTIQVAWTRITAKQILAAATDCARMVYAGSSLYEAALLVGGPVQGARLDWEALVDRFRDHRIQQTGAISERTWTRGHAPAFRALAEIATGPKPPTSATAMFLAFPWAAPGSVMRKHQVQTICRFLSWATNLGVLTPDWAPPADLGPIYGKAAKQPRPLNGALTDQEIGLLLECIHQPGWWWVIAGLALYGLRPIEILHLQRNENVITCLWQKRSSNGITRPRRLYALEPVPGLEQRWLERWHYQDRLQNMGRDTNQVGCAINIFLRRQRVWRGLKSADPNRSLVPYSFRHAYALRAAKRGIPPRFAAEAMGHTIATHLRSYSRQMDQESMDEVFGAAKS